MAERVKVSVDSDLADIVPVFLSNREKDLAVISACLEKEDYDSIKMLGHRMKGAGGGYGFPYITELGARLEEAGKGKDRDSVEELCRKLADYLERVDVIYV